VLISTTIEQTEATTRSENVEMVIMEITTDICELNDHRRLAMEVQLVTRTTKIGLFGSTLNIACRGAVGHLCDWVVPRGGTGAHEGTVPALWFVTAALCIGVSWSLAIFLASHGRLAEWRFARPTA